MLACSYIHGCDACLREKEATTKKVEYPCCTATRTATITTSTVSITPWKARYCGPVASNTLRVITAAKIGSCDSGWSVLREMESCATYVLIDHPDDLSYIA